MQRFTISSVPGTSFLSPSSSVMISKLRFSISDGRTFYLYDDETEGRENQFQVFVLSRGSVKEFSDFYLSPIVPTIEDAE